jgi:ketosteroid isomerase-like protein
MRFSMDQQRSRNFSLRDIPGTKNHKLDLIEVTGDDDLVIGSAKWSVGAKDQSGKDVVYSGVTIQVFQKQPDGSYKMRLHTFN